jgi:pSer/pThr/pTyr-binding forkhead associated (FHA) protein
MLVSSASIYETQVLAQTEDLTPADDHFGATSVLILTARNSQKSYELRPQEREGEWILGRSTRHSPVNPDIDLGDSDGNRLGISRLHLSIRYDMQYNTLTVFDLGSANGSYLNGQRLHPHEVRVLRHSDELRLGHMMLTVEFKHNR